MFHVLKFEIGILGLNTSLHVITVRKIPDASWVSLD